MTQIILSTGRVLDISDDRPYLSAVCTDTNDPTSMTYFEKMESISIVHGMLKSGEIKGKPMPDTVYNHVFCGGSVRYV